jgi:hypothetical protein
MQSYSLLIVPDDIDVAIKKSFRTSLENITMNRKNEINKRLLELGLYPQFSTLNKDIKKVVNINRSITEFIIKHNISLTSPSTP